MISEFEAKVRKIIEGLNGEAEIDTENVIDGVIDALLDAIIADRSETLRQLGHETEADALDNLAGAIIDLERAGADKVCIATIKRVQAQIAAVVKQATLAAVAALLIFLSPFTISTARAETVAGSARVIDGDTVDLDGTRIRLHGIDAPEAAQRCTDSAGRPWPCGLDAGQALRQHIGRQAVTCIRRDTDKYGRMVAVCTVGADALDVGRWMVQQGHAVAYRKYGLDYVADEDAARLARVGMWEGTFQDPSAFRHQARGEWASDRSGTGERPGRSGAQMRSRVCNCPEDRDRIGRRCGKRAASGCSVAAR